jgi:hypothetical protein
MNTLDLSNIWTISQLKAAVTLTGSHFFDRDTMRFFKSRIAPGINHTEQGITFITSEQFDDNTPRMYTLRILRSSGAIDELSDFQEFSTLSKARKAAKEYAKFAHPLP